MIVLLTDFQDKSFSFYLLTLKQSLKVCEVSQGLKKEREEALRSIYFWKIESFHIRDTIHSEVRTTRTQHDEVEPNLKKILHTNGIWGLEANSM